jgi:hypothetical protein
MGILQAVCSEVMNYPRMTQLLPGSQKLGSQNCDSDFASVVVSLLLLRQQRSVSCELPPPCLTSTLLPGKVAALWLPPLVLSSSSLKLLESGSHCQAASCAFVAPD